VTGLDLSHDLWTQKSVIMVLTARSNLPRVAQSWISLGLRRLPAFQIMNAGLWIKTKARRLCVVEIAK